MIITSVEEKVLNACHRLNAEAYEFQVLAAGKPLKHFYPCAKAEELMAVVRKGVHFGTAHLRATMTACPCHRSLSDADLMAYEMDPAYKEANYAGDRRKLYPRLYRSSTP
jgi:hypothetical protein